MTRSLRAAALASCAVVVAATVAVGASQTGPKGTLVAVGGGTIPPEITTRVVALGGGASSVVAILPQASELADTGDRAAAMWKAAGAGRTLVIDLGRRAEAERALTDASVIWMPGGDQNRLMAALAGTGLPDLIRRRYAEGAVVGGTSAGAAVLSKVMITGDADLQSVTAAATKTAEGLGLWPDVVVDQHFLKRQRAARLLSLVLDRPDLIGIGIDESTAVVLRGGQLDVIGRSSAIVVDARRARVEPATPGERGAARDVRLHVLRPGIPFSLDDPPAESSAAPSTTRPGPPPPEALRQRGSSRPSTICTPRAGSPD